MHWKATNDQTVSIPIGRWSCAACGHEMMNNECSEDCMNEKEIITPEDQKYMNAISFIPQIKAQGFWN